MMPLTVMFSVFSKLQIFLSLLEVKVVKVRILVYSLDSYAAKPAFFVGKLADSGQNIVDNKMKLRYYET